MTNTTRHHSPLPGTHLQNFCDYENVSRRETRCPGGLYLSTGWKRGGEDSQQWIHSKTEFHIDFRLEYTKSCFSFVVWLSTTLRIHSDFDLSFIKRSLVFVVDDFWLVYYCVHWFKTWRLLILVQKRINTSVYPRNAKCWVDSKQGNQINMLMVGLQIVQITTQTHKSLYMRVLLDLKC